MLANIEARMAGQPYIVNQDGTIKYLNLEDVYKQ